MARGRRSSLRLVLAVEERHPVERWQRATTRAAGWGRRGTIMLRVAAGSSHSRGAQAVGVQRPGVRPWARRFLAPRLEGLTDAPGRGANGGGPPAVAIPVVRLAGERPETRGRRRLAAHPLKPWRHPRWRDAKHPRDAACYATVSDLSELYPLGCPLIV
jgi:hypothetical protein